MENYLDIISNGDYPGNELSNFFGHSFTLDGVPCASAEGVLQSLKTRNKALGYKVCQLSGKEAKRFFHKRPQNIIWKLTGNLYWQGKRMKRDSDDYQLFLDRLYSALLENEGFRAALKASGSMSLVHSIGKKRTKQTVLTEYEFISRLERSRNTLSVGGR